jgi:pilus assembly protein CpaC
MNLFQDLYSCLKLSVVALGLALLISLSLNAQTPIRLPQEMVLPDDAPESSSTSSTARTTAVHAPEASFTTSTAGTEVIHVQAGRAQVFNTRLRIRRVYITDPAVLDSFNPTPHQLVVTAKLPGVSTLVVSDESGISHSYLIHSDLDTEPLNAALHQAFPGEDMKATGDLARVVLSGTATRNSVIDGAGKLAGQYSKDVSNVLVVNSAAAKQVELKVRVIEVDRAKMEQFGFNFFSAGGKTLAATTTNQFPSSLSVGGSSGGTSNTVGDTTVAVSNPLNFLFYNSKLNVGATLQDMATRNVAQILAEPSITTISGEKANFLSGGEFPFPVVQGSSGGLASVTVQFKSYGVKLEFTPFVNPDGTIELKVAPEVSALDFTNAVTISGYTIPALSTRRAETQVVLQSGESFAISGLLDNRTTDILSRTPGIASIPILGELFKSKNINHTKTDLIFMVTPTVINPVTTAPQVETPKLAVPILDGQTFDKNLPANKAQKSDGQK